MSAAAPPVLTPSSSLRRRRRVNRGMEALATLAALIAVAVLGIVIGSVFLKGVGALSWSFLTTSGTPTGFGGASGGVADAIVGTAVIVALGAAMAIPVGVLVAIYTTEFARPRVAGVVRFALDLLNGVPTIVTGVFVFSLLVVGHVQSGFAGAVALGIIMLPLVARAAQEVLVLVPGSLREASLALGVSRWRTVLRVVVPAAVGGILTGALLAVARAAGETAPLLFTSSIAANAVSTNVAKALPSIPVTIFTDSDVASPQAHQQAWAAALVLIAFVLVASVLARFALARTRRRAGAAT